MGCLGFGVLGFRGFWVWDPGFTGCWVSGFMGFKGLKGLRVFYGLRAFGFKVFQGLRDFTGFMASRLAGLRVLGL